MTLQDLKYFAALAEQRHFGRAAEACHVSQPTLSGQLRKLEEELGVTLLERTNKWVALTPIGEQVLIHARRVLNEAASLESLVQSAGDQLSGPLRLGAIPTIAPYLMPRILGPLNKQFPQLRIELWEDQTHNLVERLRTRELDAALLATEITEADLTGLDLFVEPFIAALPEHHRLAGSPKVQESDLAEDLMVLAEGHCLATQALSACRGGGRNRAALHASSLETLINLVVAGHGTTLIPGLAADSLARRGLVLLPFAGGASRTVRLVSRPSYPRAQALHALEKVIRVAVKQYDVHATRSARLRPRSSKPRQKK
jgi:LysR family hydrogen peroxide-inducible transcriptional activator